MGRFRNITTGVVVSVDDSKDERFTAQTGYEPADVEKAPVKKAPAKKAAASQKSE